MRRLVIIVSVLFLLTLSLLHAQTAGPAAPLKIKVRAALFDRDLNLKPVPRLAITLHSSDNASAAAILLQTTLDGVAEIEVPAGAYRLTTDKPAELFGKLYSWELEIMITKPDQVIELSNDNAKVADGTGRAAHLDELVDKFKMVRGSVVNVWTDHEAGSAFLIDPAGLVVSCESVVRDHNWIAVQYDAKRRLRADVLVADKNMNVAILRINMKPLKDAVVAPISFDPGGLIEGERVFSVENPSTIRSTKRMTTGLVNKADAKEIVTDVKFDAPCAALFNSDGTAVAYARYKEKDKNWDAVPLSAISDLIRSGKAKAADSTPPSARLLPVPPQELYPVEALLKRHETKYEKDIYQFKLGDFNLVFDTPVANYQYTQERYTAESNWRMKNAKKAQGMPPLTEPEHEYDSVLVVNVIPQYKMAFWKSLGDSMVTDGRAPTTSRPKTAFGKMMLLCDGKEVEPILPGRLPIQATGNAYVQVDQATFRGFYMYTPESISPACGEVTLKVYPAGEDANPFIKVLDKSFVDRLYKDFEPYRALARKEVPK
jgi:hypothetical protein